MSKKLTKKQKAKYKGYTQSTIKLIGRECEDVQFGKEVAVASALFKVLDVTGHGEEGEIVLKRAVMDAVPLVLELTGVQVLKQGKVFGKAMHKNCAAVVVAAALLDGIAEQEKATGEIKELSWKMAAAIKVINKATKRLMQAVDLIESYEKLDAKGKKKRMAEIIEGDDIREAVEQGIITEEQSKHATVRRVKVPAGMDAEKMINQVIDDIKRETVAAIKGKGPLH